MWWMVVVTSTNDRLAGLLENVIDTGRGLIHRTAGDQLLHPPRIQVDGVQVGVNALTLAM